MTCIALIVVSPAFLLTFLCLIFTDYKMLAIIFLFIFIILQLIGIFGFMLMDRHVHKRLTKQHFHLSKKIAQHCFGKKHIIRFTDSRVIIDEKHVYNIIFDFKGIIFKKSFIIAFVSRALRYSRVSNCLPLKELGRISLNGFSKSLVVDVVFEKKRKTKTICILKNGVSKTGIIPSIITSFKLPAASSYRFYRTNSLGSKIIPVDEEVFCLFY